MRYYYAQINNAGVCTGVIDTHAEINAPNMIQIPSPDKEYIGRTHANGEWQEAQ